MDSSDGSHGKHPMKGPDKTSKGVSEDAERAPTSDWASFGATDTTSLPSPPTDAYMPAFGLSPSKEPVAAMPDDLSSQDRSMSTSLQNAWVEDIKHEIMVNYLFQQQCSALWAKDDTDREGIILRKSRGNYLACPPQLLESGFARACMALNLQVRTHQHIEILD